ncbi:HepT-like ribonuclease domain-containing protein [Methanocaldococcus infernus]
MSKRDAKAFLWDILKSIEKIEKWSKNIEFDEFIKNDLLQDAIVRNLEIIGEASKYIPEDIKNKYPQIPWKRIVGFRNIVIHKYFGIDYEIVWFIIKNELPTFKTTIEKILKELK